MASPLTTVLQIGPLSNGILLTPEEFDAAAFEPGWRYELIHGVLIVTAGHGRAERDANDDLGHVLRNYQDEHPQGAALDATLSEETIRTPHERRRADRVIWAGLGRLPAEADVPTIVVEFVSSGKRDRQRDYEEKRDEYLALGVREYWIIDRFTDTMTVYSKRRGKADKQVIDTDAGYQTALLPGFELPLARLFEMAQRWQA
jgi:Uma2 family endonuclease